MGAREGIRFGGHGGRVGGEPPTPTAIWGSSRPQTSSAVQDRIADVRDERRPAGAAATDSSP